MYKFNIRIFHVLLLLLIFGQAVAGPLVDTCGSDKSTTSFIKTVNIDQNLHLHASAPEHAGMHNSPDETNCMHNCGFCFSHCASALPVQYSGTVLSPETKPASLYSKLVSIPQLETLFRPPIPA